MSTESNALATRIESRIDKQISANTGLTPSGAMAFRSVDQIMEFAKVMAIAGIAIPKHLRENVGACLAVAIQACEWQMSPFAVASKTYCVSDRIAFEAQLVNAVIYRRAPIVGRFKISYSGEGDSRKCKVCATLKDGDQVEYESPALSRIPVKNSPLWKGDPDQQLFYYSSRAMCRRHFPDVLLGIYTADEMEEHPEAAESIPRAVLPSPKVAAAEPVVTKTDAAPQVIAPEKKTRLPRQQKPAETPAETPGPEPAKEAPPLNAAPDQAAQNEPPLVVDESTAGQLRARLEQSGYSEDELVLMAIRMNLCKTTAKKLADIEEEKQAMILDDWEVAEASLADIRTAKGGK